MPTKPEQHEEGDPTDGAYDPELDERLRTMRDDDPAYVAWYNKVYGTNPPTSKKQVKVKKRRKSNRPRHS